MARVNTFRVGCDPEFAALTSEGQLMVNTKQFQQDGPVGWDHSGWILECRPEPAFFTRTLVRRIGRLLRDDRVRALPKVRAGAFIRGGERSFGLGGHVHLDLTPYRPPEPGGYVAVDQSETLRLQMFRSRGLPYLYLRSYSPDHTARVAALDTFTSQLEQLDILPTKESYDRRNSTEYGKYGDVRVAGQDPNWRTEYRTMGSWLTSPNVAMLCLTGAKIAAADPGGMKKGTWDYADMKSWFDKYKSDRDVEFLNTYILSKPLKTLQLDPTEDFRGKWERAGVNDGD